MFSCFRLQFKLIDSLLAILLFHVRSSTLFSTARVSSDILHVLFFPPAPPSSPSQSKTSINQPSRPKKSSATEGCETHPTARPKWWGKRRWFYSPASLQMGSETESRMRGGSKGREKGWDGGMCVRERGTSEADAADGEMVGVWMDGRGQIKGGRRRRQETLWETGEREVPR